MSLPEVLVKRRIAGMSDINGSIQLVSGRIVSKEEQARVGIKDGRWPRSRQELPESSQARGDLLRMALEEFVAAGRRKDAETTPPTFGIEV